MKETTIVSERPVKYLSFKAVLAGTLVAIGSTFLFNLLTVALGLSLFTTDQEGLITLTFSTVAWVVIGGYMTLFIAGWVTGRLVQAEYSFHLANGVLHGFVMWTLYLIVSVVLLSMIAEVAALKFIETIFLNFPGNIENAQRAAGNISTEDINKTGYTALAVFFVFIVGALGACIGASCGIKESKRVCGIKL